MDHTQTLDLVVVDTVLDKVAAALGLVDRAGQELNDALPLEPGADGRPRARRGPAAPGRRRGCAASSRSPAGPGTACRRSPGPKSHLFTCGECGLAEGAFEALQNHVYGVHLGAAVGL